MPKTKTPPPDFRIHVDSSCMTDSTDLAMPAERSTSNQTVVHHDSWSGDPKPEDNKIEKDEDPEKEENEEEKNERRARERQIDRIEAQIHAAAKAVVASIEHDNYNGDESVLSVRTDENYDMEPSLVSYTEGTELSTRTDESYEDNSQLTFDGTEEACETEDEHHEAEGDSSSHHDGDIDDDVFSHSGRSGRSSLNSCHESSDDANRGKELTSPVVGEEAAEPVSRIPSSASYVPRDIAPHTPSKVLSRPPFRTPSSVRAMQMSSPTPSIFSSQRSAKRQMPTVSRIGTPTSLSSFSPSKKTPTRFKKKLEPLVLLHVTVLPLKWAYSQVISSPDVPRSLDSVRENHRLLQEKLSDTVLERGILLPHPQDSYEVLEERLLEALELPVRPRARILKCGHYMGPETPSSDEEGTKGGEGYLEVKDRKWCDICARDVKIEGSGMDAKSERRFRVKVYASNGLMRAGAWAACWREMERVDVELEPFVEGELALELEHFVTLSAKKVPCAQPQHEDDGFVDVEEMVEPVHEKPIDIEAIRHEEEMRVHEEELRVNEEELRVKEEEELRRQMMEEERMREIYGDGHPRAESRTRTSRRTSSRAPQHGDSLPELLLAAFKLAMRDRKNVVIGVLSVLVLLLALKPNYTPRMSSQVVMDSGFPEVVGGLREPVVETLARPIEVVVEKAVETNVAAERTVEIVRTVQKIENEPCIIPECAKEIAKESPYVEVEAKPASPAIEPAIGGPAPASQGLPSLQPDIEEVTVMEQLPYSPLVNREGIQQA
jgi:hypothetical protein